jgi:hypothetical protein
MIKNIFISLTDVLFIAIYLQLQTSLKRFGAILENSKLKAICMKKAVNVDKFIPKSNLIFYKHE